MRDSQSLAFGMFWHIDMILTYWPMMDAAPMRVCSSGLHGQRAQRVCTLSALLQTLGLIDWDAVHVKVIVKVAFSACTRC